MTSAVVVGCGLVVGYLWLCYLGTLLMRLVLVQPVDSALARLSFAATFASSVGLFLIVLADAVAGADTHSAHTRFATPHRLLHTLLRGGAVGRAAGGQGDTHDEDAVLTLFRVLLASLLIQVLVVGPLSLLCMVLWNRLSERRRRLQAGSEHYPAMKSPYDGDVYGGRPTRGGEPGVVRRLLQYCRCCCCFCCCWPSGTGMRAVCVLVFLVVCGGAALFLFHTPHRMLALTPAVAAAARTARDYARRVSGALLRSLTIPAEVRPRSPDPNTPPLGASARFDSLRGMASVEGVRARGAALLPSRRLLSAVLETVVANVGVAGVALMGVLGGYAAVTTPYHYLLPYVYYRTREGVLRQAQQALARKQRYALSLYASRQRRLAQESWRSRVRLAPGQEDVLYDRTNAQNEKAHRSATSRGGPAPGGGWLGFVVQRTCAAVRSAASLAKTRLGRGEAGGHSTRTSVRDRQQLRDEAEHARCLSLSLYLYMDETGYMLSEAKRGGTWVGRLLALCGLLLGLYSLMKFFLTAASLYLFHHSTQDPVTRAIALLEAYWVLPPQQLRQPTLEGNGAAGEGFSITAVQVSTQLVLGLVVVMNAWMLAASIRGLMLTIFQLTLSFTSVVTANTTAVVFAMLMAVYFLGQVILLRQSLPAPRAAAVGGGAWAGGGSALAPGERDNVLFAALGSLPTYFYQRLNDWCFLIGCVATVIARRWILGDPSKISVSIANG